jgi:predicted GNAT family acetyltransferase
MTVTLTNDAAAFRDAVFDTLRTDPVLNTVMLTAVAQRAEGAYADGPPATYARLLDDDGALVTTAMRTPPHFVLLSAGTTPEQAVLLADAMSDECADAIGVHAVRQAATAFAERWNVLLGKQFRLYRENRLHRLESLTVPEVPGSARLAEADDLPLVVEWMKGFAADVGERAGALEDEARRGIDGGGMWLWCADDGEPASLAAHKQPVHGAARVGPVYTPPALRGHGYASAVTAHVSRLLRDAGHQVCLHTDLANPTSNKIYATIGYRPVADFVIYDFD